MMTPYGAAIGPTGCLIFILLTFLNGLSASRHIALKAASDVESRPSLTWKSAIESYVGALVALFAYLLYLYFPGGVVTRLFKPK